MLLRTQSRAASYIFPHLALTQASSGFCPKAKAATQRRAITCRSPPFVGPWSAQLGCCTSQACLCFSRARSRRAPAHDAGDRHGMTLTLTPGGRRQTRPCLLPACRCCRRALRRCAHQPGLAHPRCPSLRRQPFFHRAREGSSCVRSGRVGLVVATLRAWQLATMRLLLLLRVAYTPIAAAWAFMYSTGGLVKNVLHAAPAVIH